MQLKDGSKQNGQPKTLDDYEPYGKDGAKLALNDEEKAKYEVRDGGLQQVQGAAWCACRASASMPACSALLLAAPAHTGGGEAG